MKKYSWLIEWEDPHDDITCIAIVSIDMEKVQKDGDNIEDEMDRPKNGIKILKRYGYDPYFFDVSSIYINADILYDTLDECYRRIIKSVLIFWE